MTVKWNQDGLVPVVIQCARTMEVLMCAWMNTESLALTIENKRTVFWSRKRQSLWYKGATSGAVQLVKEIYLDCDNDCLLIKVEQLGMGACHTGKKSCFFHRYDDKNEEL